MLYCVYHEGVVLPEVSVPVVNRAGCAGRLQSIPESQVKRWENIIIITYVYILCHGCSNKRIMWALSLPPFPSYFLERNKYVIRHLNFQIWIQRDFRFNLPSMSMSRHRVKKFLKKFPRQIPKKIEPFKYWTQIEYVHEQRQNEIIWR